MAGPVTDVSALVVEMQDLLATIQNTLASLDPNVQDAKLDELERKRDDAIEALSNAYLAESELLNRKRKAEREALAEQRRKEDEERERRRHEEDEELAARDRDEDQARDGRFKEDTEEVEEEMDGLMNLVEEEARIAAAEGREKIRAMQERRRVGFSPSPELRERALTTISTAGTQPSHRGTVGDVADDDSGRSPEGEKAHENRRFKAFSADKQEIRTHPTPRDRASTHKSWSVTEHAWYYIHSGGTCCHGRRQAGFAAGSHCSRTRSSLNRRRISRGL
jgi:hypothetical protein